mgnify:CR=1 FL=1
MNKEQQIEEMAVIGCVRNPQAHNAEECAKCEFKNGQCNSYRHTEALYNAGYRKLSEDSVVLSRKEHEILVKTAQGKIGNMKATDFLRACISSGFMVEAVSTKEQVNQAVKDFAEKLKNIIHERDYIQGYAEIGLIEEIDELLEEY